MGLSAPLAALCWDAKGDWARAHTMVCELETVDGMAVHAYTARRDLPRMLITGTSAPAAAFTG